MLRQTFVYGLVLLALLVPQLVPGSMMAATPPPAPQP